MRSFMIVGVIVSLLAPASALAQDPPTVHVTAVEGPVARRAIVRALDPVELRHCQHTHMGHPVRFTLVIDAQGAASITGVVAHEEVRSYVPCIEQLLARARLGTQTGETRAQVTVVFHPSAVVPSR